MFNLSEDDRQMVKDQHGKHRTRQNDAKKRHTNNSSREETETTSPFYLKDNLLPKKQKVNNSCIKNQEKEVITAKQITTKGIIDSVKDKEKILDDSDEKNLIMKNNNNEPSLSNIKKEYVRSGKENLFISNIQTVSNDIKTSNNILGIGHVSVIHLFARDTLFQKIKILSDHHLESNGEIMKTIMDKLNYSEKLNGNYIAFTNAVRSEIRKTICAKRGYVKRQIGILIKGMFLIYVFFIDVFYFIF
jgi:hypothetical protein